MDNPLAEILNGHLASRGWSFAQLARASRLPKNTIYQWNKGRVSRVHQWQHLARIAQALELDREKTNALLAAGGHASLTVISMRAEDHDDLALLEHWPPPLLAAPLIPESNVPHPLTSFVGRQDELTQISTLLVAPEIRLVTLTGPGGSGKTRLAVEAAQRLVEEFDAIDFVELAAAANPDQVILSITRTLGIGESPDVPPFQSLVTHLRGAHVLLVLDNFEQVIEAAPLVAKLLESTRRVQALVTSRTRLHVRGEHEIAISPLPLPSPDSGFDDLVRNPSVVLFADRARAVDPSFELTSTNVQLVAEVCVHLDGLPLAIELAAVRVRQVKMSSMLERFPDRLTLASGGPRDAPDRQRTLRATIAWSYDLLNAEEQQLFACTSVFAGGFTNDGLSAICSALGYDAIEVASGLDWLADQSLLQRSLNTDDGEPRYEILETIREYALEKLTERGEIQDSRQAHATYYLGLAERVRLLENGHASTLSRMVVELANIRTALGWCKDLERAETGLRFCMALMPLWQVQDHQLEARAWLETFMAMAGPASPILKAGGLLWQGLLLMHGTGEVVAASRLVDDALVLFRHEGDLEGESEALQAVGDAFRQQEDWGRASQQYAESLNLAEQSGNAYLAAHGYFGLALCAQELGRFDDAQQHWELMLEWAEHSGNRPCVALALNSLGEMARYLEDWTVAERYYQQTLTLAREFGSESRMALALHNLGYVALHGGESERAGQLFADSLRLYKGPQYDKGKAECLAGLGWVEAVEGRFERAARLCGASEALLNNLKTRLDTLDRADYERTLRLLRSELGERLIAFLNEGRTMSVGTAMEYAFADRVPNGSATTIVGADGRRTSETEAG